LHHGFPSNLRRGETVIRGRQVINRVDRFSKLLGAGQCATFRSPAAIEFSDPVRAMSIHNFGESSDPSSSHYFDQAALYARREFKPAWFTTEEVNAHTERVHRPAD
jgi:acyl-homoserine lactone acylase PvdQ